MVRKGSGWHGEPKRHSEAVRKGMKTRYQGKTGVRTVKRKMPKRIVRNRFDNKEILKKDIDVFAHTFEQHKKGKYLPESMELSDIVTHWGRGENVKKIVKIINPKSVKPRVAYREKKVWGGTTEIIPYNFWVKEINGNEFTLIEGIREEDPLKILFRGRINAEHVPIFFETIRNKLFDFTQTDISMK